MIGMSALLTTTMEEQKKLIAALKERGRASATRSSSAAPPAPSAGPTRSAPTPTPRTPPTGSRRSTPCWGTEGAAGAGPGSAGDGVRVRLGSDFAYRRGLAPDEAADRARVFAAAGSSDTPFHGLAAFTGWRVDHKSRPGLAARQHRLQREQTRTCGSPSSARAAGARPSRRQLSRNGHRVTVLTLTAAEAAELRREACQRALPARGDNPGGRRLPGDRGRRPEGRRAARCTRCPRRPSARSARGPAPLKPAACLQLSLAKGLRAHDAQTSHAGHR